MCFHIFYIITQIIFSLLSYVPCAFYLFLASCVSSQVKSLLFVQCFHNNFLKINFNDPFHLKDAASTFQWKIKLKKKKNQKLPGHSTALAYSRARACCTCSRCGMGGLFFFCVFFFSSILSFLF